MFQNRSIDHLRTSLSNLLCKGCMYWDWTKREGEFAPCDRAADPRRTAELGEENAPVRVVALPMLTHETHFCAEHTEPTAHGKKLREQAEAEAKVRTWAGQALPLDEAPPEIARVVSEAPLTETYPNPDDVGGWLGVIEPENEAWIAFVAIDGRTLLWTEREPDGGVIGMPYYTHRLDLAKTPVVA